MAVICSIRHSTNLFSYSGKVLVVEDSTLSGGHNRETFGRVYDDACDEGFVLVSHRTGEQITFVIDHLDMNGDEIAGWRLVPLDKHGRRDLLKDFTVLVIND